MMPRRRMKMRMMPMVIMTGGVGVEEVDVVVGVESTVVVWVEEVDVVVGVESPVVVGVDVVGVVVEAVDDVSREHLLYLLQWCDRDTETMHSELGRSCGVTLSQPRRSYLMHICGLCVRWPPWCWQTIKVSAVRMMRRSTNMCMAIN